MNARNLLLGLRPLREPVARPEGGEKGVDSLRKADPKFKPLNTSQPIEHVKKTLLFDFQDLNLPSQGLAWDQLPEKWEGLVLLNNNRLLVMSDNDFLNPELNLSGKKIPFPKCQAPVPTWLFTIQLP